MKRSRVRRVRRTSIDSEGIDQVEFLPELGEDGSGREEDETTGRSVVVVAALD